MAIPATVVADGTDIVLGGSMDPVSQAVFDQLYQDCAAGILGCREHRSADGRVHGAWLYLQIHATSCWPDLIGYVDHEPAQVDQDPAGPAPSA